MNKVYYWKELSRDGLLREPEDVGCGPPCERDSVNRYGSGFYSEHGAVAYLEGLKKEHPDNMQYNRYVLITEYSFSEEES